MKRLIIYLTCLLFIFTQSCSTTEKEENSLTPKPDVSQFGISKIESVNLASSKYNKVWIEATRIEKTVGRLHWDKAEIYSFIPNPKLKAVSIAIGDNQTTNEATANSKTLVFLYVEDNTSTMMTFIQENKGSLSKKNRFTGEQITINANTGNVVIYETYLDGSISTNAHARQASKQSPGCDGCVNGNYQAAKGRCESSYTCDIACDLIGSACKLGFLASAYADCIAYGSCKPLNMQ